MGGVVARKRRSLSKRVGYAAMVLCFSFVSATASSKLFGRHTSTHVGIEKEANGTQLCGGEAESTCEANLSQDTLLWIIIMVLGILYSFVALAVVCDDFFVASLEVICEELSLTPDVAGATFMAAGSSAPELFTSVVGVFFQKSDVGVGTILGSAVFNILIIIGLTALLAGQSLQLDWKPLARDSVYYALSIVLMTLMFQNRSIDWYEALFLLFAYAMYLVMMKYNTNLMAFLDHVFASPNAAPTKYEPQHRRPSLKVLGHVLIAAVRLRKAGEEHARKRDNPSASELGSEDGFPESAQQQFLWIIARPCWLLFKYTIPDCSKPRFRKYYLVTFLMSVAWIGIACFFMVDWARSLGCLLDISPAVMGLTLLAAGTSVPDALSSVFVAQDGEGDMAVSNAIGSNVFDILLGLGLPWMLSILITGESVAVCSDGMVKATILLFLVLLMVVGTLAWSGWILTPRVGLAMFIMYFLFVVYSLLDEYLHLVQI